MRCINAAYVGMRCPSVYLSRSWIMSKRISVGLSKFFHHRVATQNDNSSFSIPNGVAIFRREPPNGGVEYRWGRQKNEILVVLYRALLDICILVLTAYLPRNADWSISWSFRINLHQTRTQYSNEEPQHWNAAQFPKIAF